MNEHDRFGNDAALEREIRRSVQAYFDGCNESYTTGRRDILHSVCAAEMVGFGTGPHEKARTRDAFEDTLFGEKTHGFERIDFRLQWIHVHRVGDMASAYGEVDAEIRMNGKVSTMPPLRASWTFALRSARGAQLPWQMLHIHYSFPDTQTEDENIDMRSLAEYNRALQQKVEEKTQELHAEKEKSERLLLNILPVPIAQRLKQGESPIANRAEHVVILFADIVDFTPLAASVTADEVVRILDRVFSCFDAISERHGLEKIKTVGDAYMAVAGIPEPCEDPIERAAEAALEMQQAVRPLGGREPMQLRIGLNAGPVVAGVIGQRKFSYDLWGDAVNVAARMESHGVPDRIQVTDEVRRRLGDRYLFESRGEIEVKGKGRMHTHFLVGRQAAAAGH